jgi:hypothetical protein
MVDQSGANGWAITGEQAMKSISADLIGHC